MNAKHITDVESVNDWIDNVLASAQEHELSPLEMIGGFELMKSQIIEAATKQETDDYEKN